MYTSTVVVVILVNGLRTHGLISQKTQQPKPLWLPTSSHRMANFHPQIWEVDFGLMKSNVSAPWSVILSGFFTCRHVWTTKNNQKGEQPIGHDKPNPQCKRSYISVGSHGPTWMFDCTVWYLGTNPTVALMCILPMLGIQWYIMVYTASIHI